MLGGVGLGRWNDGGFFESWRNTLLTHTHTHRISVRDSQILIVSHRGLERRTSWGVEAGTCPSLSPHLAWPGPMLNTALRPHCGRVQHCSLASGGEWSRPCMESLVAEFRLPVREAVLLSSPPPLRVGPRGGVFLQNKGELSDHVYEWESLHLAL
ncbi:UNVERIFIED_CONTAM: hypothetical protein K2H54_048777 [Gekko kuhli]